MDSSLLKDMYGFKSESELRNFFDMISNSGLEHHLKTIWKETAFAYGGVNQLVFIAWFKDSMKNNRKFLRDLGSKIELVKGYYMQTYKVLKDSQWRDLFFGKQCPVCLDQPVQVQISPCNHVKACAKCYWPMKEAGLGPCTECGAKLGAGYYI